MQTINRNEFRYLCLSPLCSLFPHGPGHDQEGHYPLHDTKNSNAGPHLDTARVLADDVELLPSHLWRCLLRQCHMERSWHPPGQSRPVCQRTNAAVTTDLLREIIDGNADGTAIGFCGGDKYLKWRCACYTDHSATGNRVLSSWHEGSPNGNGWCRSCSGAFHELISSCERPRGCWDPTDAVTRSTQLAQHRSKCFIGRSRLRLLPVSDVVKQNSLPG